MSIYWLNAWYLKSQAKSVVSRIDKSYKLLGYEYFSSVSIFFGSLVHTVLWITIDSASFLRYFQETTDYGWILLLREIVFAKSKAHVKGYRETLHRESLPFIAEIKDKKTMFRQDDAPFHTATAAKTWFQNFEAELLPWTISRPDLKPIDNLWGTLAREVYDQEKPHTGNIVELKTGIESAWADIQNEASNEWDRRNKKWRKIYRILTGNVTKLTEFIFFSHRKTQFQAKI